MLYVLLALIVLVISILLDAHLYNLVTSHRITLKCHNACKKANDIIPLALVIVLTILCIISAI